MKLKLKQGIASGCPSACSSVGTDAINITPLLHPDDLFGCGNNLYIGIALFLQCPLPGLGKTRDGYASQNKHYHNYKYKLN
jgi:hypothetical protein